MLQAFVMTAPGREDEVWLVALASAFFLTSLWVSEWGTAWIWELLFPMIAAFALALDHPGRIWGLDRWLARRYPGLPLW